MHQSKMVATSGQVAEKGPVGKEFQDIHCLHMVDCNPQVLKNVTLSRLKKLVLLILYILNHYQRQCCTTFYCTASS